MTEREVPMSTAQCILRCRVCGTQLPSSGECPKCRPTEKTPAKPLMTLEEHDRHRMMAHAEAQKPQPNGIACPKCEAEMVDTNPGVMLTCHPPRRYIGCPKCGWEGTRSA